jgi:hypothetical protein
MQGHRFSVGLSGILTSILAAGQVKRMAIGLFCYAPHIACMSAQRSLSRTHRGRLFIAIPAARSYQKYLPSRTAINVSSLL